MHAGKSLTTLLIMSLVWLGGAGTTIRAVSAEIDLTRAVVVVPDGLSGPENKAVRLLIEEVRARSGVTWDVSLRWPNDAVPIIAVGPDRLLRSEMSPVRELIAPQAAA